MQTTTNATRLERSEVERLVREVLTQRLKGGPGGATPPPSVQRYAFEPGKHAGQPNPLVVNVSARHMHATPEVVEQLFGKGRTLTKLKDLYQQGEFASEQLVT